MLDTLQLIDTIEEAREIFKNLSEAGSVAEAWHGIGVVHQYAGQPEAAERAYRESLAIKVRLPRSDARLAREIAVCPLYSTLAIFPSSPPSPAREEGVNCLI